MTRDPRSPGFDDPTIEQLVRDVVGEWSMPPVRLDAPGWRERVRSSRTRRLAAAGGWFGRLGQAATAAIALTVVGALVAVVITRPPAPGKTPEPTSGSRPSPGTQATPLPKIYLPGSEPDPAFVVMRGEGGDFSGVDLATGSINGPLTHKSSSSEVRDDGTGSILCLCVADSGSIGGMATDMVVSLDRYDTRGKLSSSRLIAQFSGEPDPRDEGTFIPERPAHVLTWVGFSDDGKYGLVGWSERAHPVWHSGVLVVDVGDGSILSRQDLPDATDGEGNTRRMVEAPRFVGTIGDGRIAIAQGWYEWSPPASEMSSYAPSNAIFTASFRGGVLGEAAIVPAANSCASVVKRAGPLPDGGFWIACTDGGAGLTLLRRFNLDGSLRGDVRVTGSGGIETDPTAVSADGSTLFVWDPRAAELSRVDVATGGVTSGKGTAASETGPMVALGNWLAPAVAAKSWLRSGLTVSPDGTRVYALGVHDGGSGPETAGSAGVFVFDATTLQAITIWQPTADYVSIAVSPDGRLVYAAGLPGVDAAGVRAARQQASITVFDASDGSIRVIAGQLGSDALSFLTTRLP